jgi:GGDEF domain-containing protein
MFSERLRFKVEKQLPITISGGVAMAIEGDTQDTLLARADHALYAAKSAGRNSVFYHDGTQANAVQAELVTTEAAS